MLPEVKICWFCMHACREGRPDKRGALRIHEWCELRMKRLSAERHEDFRRCKGFEPRQSAIASREADLHRVIRECRVELGYLERLSVYAEHRRRRGAEYEHRVHGFKPLFPEREKDGDGKTVCADGFEEEI